MALLNLTFRIVNDGDNEWEKFFRILQQSLSSIMSSDISFRHSRIFERWETYNLTVTAKETGRLKLDWKDRIIINPEILAGKPVIKGTRIAVEFILDLIANGWDYEKISDNYPQLEKEDVIAALRYAAETLKAEKVYPLA